MPKQAIQKKPCTATSRTGQNLYRITNEYYSECRMNLKYLLLIGWKHFTCYQKRFNQNNSIMAKSITVELNGVFFRTGQNEYR